MDHKSAKEAALKKLMDALDADEGEQLRGLKKPSITELSIEAEPKDDLEHSGEPSDFQSAWEELKGKKSVLEPDDSDEDDEMSDEEKQRISDLYHKHVAPR